MHPEAMGQMARQDGLITSAQARACGMTPPEIRRELQARRWVSVRRGVMADAAVWEAADEFRGRPLLRVRAAHLTMRRDHWFSHDSSAVLLGMPLPDPRRSLVHVTRPGVTGNRLKAGVKHHLAPFEPDQMIQVDELPALDQARTAVDLCREHGLTAGLAACDFALRNGVSRHELRAVVERMRWWPQVRMARTVIDLADPGAESFGESATRLLLIELGCGRPETQFGLTDGSQVAWCDLRVGRHIVEFDGRVKYALPENGGHATDPGRALWSEKLRQDFVCGFKLGMSRVTYADLHRPDATRARLARDLADTTARFGTDISDLAPYIIGR